MEIPFAAFVVLLIEIAIALFINDSVIRPFVGDFLVVVLMYLGCRAIFNFSSEKIALGVLIFAFFIEVLQLFHLVDILGLGGNSVARIILGSTFDWWDLLAYVLGIGLIYGLDHD